MTKSLEEADATTSATVHRSDGADDAVIVLIDTQYEPDNSDGKGGLRVFVNDECVYEGAPFVPFDGQDRQEKS